MCCCWRSLVCREWFLRHVWWFCFFRFSSPRFIWLLFFYRWVPFGFGEETSCFWSCCCWRTWVCRNWFSMHVCWSFFVFFFVFFFFCFSSRIGLVVSSLGFRDCSRKPGVAEKRDMNVKMYTLLVWQCHFFLAFFGLQGMVFKAYLVTLFF